jgi:hypothetical protein
MKKLLTALGFLTITGSLFLLSMFAGCSNDDENPEEEINMVGLWTVTGVEISDASVAGQSVVDFFINIGGLSEEDANAAFDILESMIIASITGTIDIREDNTYTSVLGGETESGTWSQSADGNTFYIYDTTDDEFEATIVTLTNNMAKINFIYDTYQDLDQNPITPDILLTIKGLLTLTK